MPGQLIVLVTLCSYECRQEERRAAEVIQQQTQELKDLDDVVRQCESKLLY